MTSGEVPLGRRGAFVLLLGAVVLCGWSWSLLVDFAAWPETRGMRDDAYYYFAWARSVAGGTGPAASVGFDGLPVPTNGVQPLWAWLLSACAWFTDASRVRTFEILATSLGLTAFVAAGWVMATDRAARGLTTPLRFTLFLAWCSTPFLLVEAQNGQETALAVLALALLWRARASRGLVFASCAVGAVLARADLYGAVVGVALARWLVSRRGRLDSANVDVGTSGHFVSLLVAVALPLGVLAGANLATSGSLLADSARPIPELFELAFQATNPTAYEEWARLWWFTRPVLLGGPWALATPVLVAATLAFLVLPWTARWSRRLFGQLHVLALTVIGGLVLLAGWLAGGSARGLLVPGLALVCLIVLVGFGVCSRTDRSADEPDTAVMPKVSDRAALWGLLFGLAALIALHTVVRGYPREYYFAPVAVFGFAALPRLQRVGPWILGAALLCSAMQLVRGAPHDVVPSRPWQEEMSMAGRYLTNLLPSGAKVGCFNSGLVTVYARDGGVSVINLDGVVHRHAADALRAKTLWRALQEHGVHWLIDTPAQFATVHPWPHASGSRFGFGPGSAQRASPFDAERDLIEVARFDVPWWVGQTPGLDSFRLYRFLGADAVLRPQVEGLSVIGRGGLGTHVLWSPGATVPPGTELADLPFSSRESAKRDILAVATAGVVQILCVPHADYATSLWVGQELESRLVIPAVRR